MNKSPQKMWHEHTDFPPNELSGLSEILVNLTVSYISGPKVIKLFSCTTQLSMTFILLINVKMLFFLTFISRINDWLW